MSKRPTSGRRGNAMLEFTLIGIPMIFLVIGTIEMARGMWIYHTLAHAVKEGARYAVVHGQGCAIPPNDCRVNISQISRVIRSAGTGLPANTVTLTFTPATGSATSCVLSACLTNFTTSAWPPDSASAPGVKLKISGSYPFRSAITMFWPGAGRPVPFRAVTLGADSRESIQY